jgi:hypothetical protein
MAKIDMFGTAKIDIKGQLFDLGEVYKHAHEWLEWHKYDVVESKYAEKTKADGKELKITWEATRDVDEYTRFEIDVKWTLYGVNDVEMAHEGKKIKLQSGNLVIETNAFVITDYDGKWETSRQNKFLKSFFEKYLYAGDLTRLKGQIWKQGWDFYNEMKAFLDLYQY